jgi:Flp pilus assembly protein TadG
MNSRLHNQSGHAVVEFTLGGLMLLLLLFGMIDFGRAIYTKQILTSLSREAANLTSRGTTFTNTLAAIKSSATPLDIDRNGYVVLTAIARGANDQVIVTEQLTGGGQADPSRIAPGGVGSTPALPATTEGLPQSNQTMYVAEVSYGFSPVTPIGKLLGAVLPSSLYDAALF